MLVSQSVAIQWIAVATLLSGPSVHLFDAFQGEKTRRDTSNHRTWQVNVRHS